MKEDLIFKYCGIFIALILLLGFISNVIPKKYQPLHKINNNKIKKREAFTVETSPASIRQNISDQITELSDYLAIYSYKNNYEDLIIELDKWCDLQLLSILIKGKIGAESYSSEAGTDIRSYNSLIDFKANLNKTMAFLDKN
jgi:hypothetical protein|tara:strand:+ start:297 stop:722 length:426 start_codon:yes stop_codon:yes gene_type:complete